jgi:hypothetical protein
LSEENSANIRTNTKNINDINNYNKNLYNKLSDTFEDINSRLDSITNDLNNTFPDEGSDGEILIKGKDKNTWTDLTEIPISLSDFSEENEVLGLFKVVKHEFVLGTILNDNPTIEIYIDGVLQDLDEIYKNNDGHIRFFKGISFNISNEIVDVEIFGNREKDIIKYNDQFLKLVKYSGKTFLDYDPFNGSDDNYKAFFSSSNQLIELNNLTIGDNALEDSSKYLFYNCLNLVNAEKVNIGNCTDLKYLFYSCINLVSCSFKDTSKVNNMNSMFKECTSLTKIEELDVSKAENVGDMFINCNKLSYIKLVSSNINNLKLVINELPKHENAVSNAYIIDLKDCKIDISTITTPEGWTIKTT